MLLKQIARFVRTRRGRRIGPVLGDDEVGGPEDSPITFVMVCRDSFDAHDPGAESKISLGFCRGFEQLGVRYRLVGVADVAKIVPKLREPFMFLTMYSFRELDERGKELLRSYPHFVWVEPWSDGLEEVYANHGLPNPRALYPLSHDSDVTRQLLEANPAFLWAPIPPSCLVFYKNWLVQGQRVESIPLACDNTMYYPEPEDRRYSNVEMAFVGGYWGYKATQFTKYLKPYEDVLRVYGYSRWPYRGYSGVLNEEDERVLYQNATVCPALSEPHAEVIGDIVERAFKVLGSGGLAVTDTVAFYRELFGPEELLVPRDIDEYHSIVTRAMNDKDFNMRYRRNGYNAVMGRHTYVHRARQILNLLGLEAPNSRK